MSDIRMLVHNTIVAIIFAVLLTFLAFAATCFIYWKIVSLPTIMYRGVFVVSLFVGCYHAQRTKP